MKTTSMIKIKSENAQAVKMTPRLTKASFLHELLVGLISHYANSSKRMQARATDTVIEATPPNRRT